MAEKTSQMVALLGRMRKEMNGAVADTMFCYGKPYGLNYGVSLPTIRTIAHEIEKNQELAQYIYQQQVRELQLAAMHIAECEQMSLEDIDRWGEGLINSEMAEEMAFALLRHYPSLSHVYHKWCYTESEFKVYAALLAAAKSDIAKSEDALESITHIVSTYPHSRPIAQGAVALLAEAYNHEELKPHVKSLLAEFKPSPAADYIREEMEWRMEF